MSRRNIYQEVSQTSDVLEIEHGIPQQSSSVRDQSQISINSSSNTLNVFFQCCYYMLLLPFRPEYGKTTGRCTLGGARFQKILVYYIMWPLIITNDITKAVKQLVKASTGSMTIHEYFRMFAKLLYYFKQLKFLYVAYKRQRLIQKYLSAVKTNSLLKKPTEEYSKSKFLCKMNQYLGWSLPFLILIFIVYLTNYVLIILHHYNDKSLPKNRLIVAFGNPNGTELNPIWKHVGGVTEIVLGLAGLMDLFLVHLFLLLPIPLWIGMQRLETLVMCPTGHINFQEILGKYGEMKEMCRLCNEIWGSLTFLWILDHSMYIVLRFELFHSTERVETGLLLGKQWLLILALLMAGEVTRIVARLKEHLIIHFKHGELATFHNEEEVAEMIDELKTFPVALGSPGVYTLDYAFLAQVLCSVVVTLFVAM